MKFYYTIKYGISSHSIVKQMLWTVLNSKIDSPSPSHNALFSLFLQSKNISQSSSRWHRHAMINFYPSGKKYTCFVKVSDVTFTFFFEKEKLYDNFFEL